MLAFLSACFIDLINAHYNVRVLLFMRVRLLVCVWDVIGNLLFSLTVYDVVYGFFVIL